jgi:predicted metal-dependent peptidase
MTPPAKTGNPLIDLAARTACERRAAEKLKAARTWLMLQKTAAACFFGSLLYQLPSRADWSCDTAWTDGVHIGYSPAFVDGLPMEQVAAVLVHEVMHLVLSHHARRAGRTPVRWNVAADAALNHEVRKGGFALPQGVVFAGEKGGPLPDARPGLTAEAYYEMLPDEAECAKKYGPGPGEVRDGPADGADGQSGAVKGSAADWKEKAARARAAAQAAGRGDLPAGLGRSVSEALKPAVDWCGVLRDFMTERGPRERTHSRPDKRLWPAIFAPGRARRRNAAPPVVIAVDTSGSISPAMLDLFAAECAGVAAACGSELAIVYHDAAVAKVDLWDPADGLPLKLSPAGGGGTSHACVFEWCAANAEGFASCGLPAACAVCLTDLYTQFPDAAPHLDVLWCVPRSANPDPRPPPFGRLVAVDDAGPK